ncbi:amino acid adenylation domain-containing protein [Stigmatella sp. ncwal1]|uniref:Amino acid adenylation domain-containing protein n=1 Tax=Stigmatella ashevillensis TaxID=2995309 RepID=A0ABT5DP71_9BACT|nr:non-ribosomal peptide synthetase [Stigmatella ashevillena]MDC0714166.1 amino acid adenylation domain-containing protein [Stigmatella ashevillena]
MRLPSLIAPRHHPTIVDLLQLRAREQGNQITYRFLGSGDPEGAVEEWSLAHLDLLARSIGAALQEANARGERALLIYAPGLEFIAAFMGCLYAGVTAVPCYPPDPSRLDRTLPRMRAIVRDCEARFILTTTPILEMVGALATYAPELLKVRWIATDSTSHDLASAYRRPDLDEGSLAFLQYTSGSTGTPKGVMVSHANLMHNERMIEMGFEINHSAVIVGWLPMFHDMGLIGQVLQPLYLGASVTLMSPLDFLQRPYRWLQTISHLRATVSGGPNFAYELCARKVTPEERATLDLSSWDVAFTGAEPVRRETLDRFSETFSACGFRRGSFHACYGLAEATLFVSGASREAGPVIHEVDRAALQRHQVVEARGEGADSQWMVSSGCIASEVRVEIVNPETSEACRAGEVGEIWVAGPSVALGYWGRPEETQQVFHARLANKGTGPFLRTGDLGFFIGEELFISGRFKDVIILRGRNHYPQDIEHTVERAHPCVRPGCCAAFSVEVSGEEQLIVAVEVKLHGEERAATVADAIRRAVADHHEVHVHAVALLRPGTILKTTSGKIQRRGCRQLYLEGGLELEELSIRGERVSYVAPCTPVEASLTQILAEVLELERVGMEDDFLVLGGNSLSAMQVSARIRDGLQAELPIRTLFEHPKVSHLAEVIERALGAAAEGRRREGVLLTRAPRNQPLPLSHAQQRLWFLDKLHPGSAEYLVSEALRLEGPLMVEVLEAALNEVVQRHELLRTSFPERQGVPYQHIAPSLKVAVDVVDLGSLPAERREAEARRLATAEARRPFDLSRLPLVRCSVFQLTGHDHVICFVLHHLVADGWSRNLLLRELHVLYEALSKGTEAVLPTLSLQYADYTVWQHQALLEAERSRGTDYWVRQLANLPGPLDLPTDKHTPNGVESTGGQLSMTLGSELTHGLQALCQERKVTPFMVLLAAWSALLHRYTGAEDIPVGSPIALRPRLELEPLIGLFLNTLVMRTRPSASMPFLEFLEQIRTTVLEAEAHREVPFEHLVARLQPERNLERSPFFEVMVNVFQLSPVRDFSPQGLQARPFQLKETSARFALTLYGLEHAGHLELVLLYRQDRFSPARAACMLEQFEHLLRQVMAAPERPLGACSLVTPLSRLRLPDPTVTLSLVPYEPVPNLLRAQARHFAQKSAIYHQGRTWNYETLGEAMAALARALLARGLEPHDVVAVTGPKSFGLIAAMSAVLAARGVLLSLDPRLPGERQRLMLRRAGARYLLHVASESEHPESLFDGLTRLEVSPAEGRLLDAPPTGEPAPCPLPEIQPEDPAYIFFTSGTTGLPKAVLGWHTGLSHFLHWQRESFGIGPADRAAQLTALSFDVLLRDVFTPLTSGATLCIPGEEELGDPCALLSWMEHQRITLLHTVPTLARSWLEYVPEQVHLGTLRWAFFAGEPLSHSLVEGWRSRFPGAGGIVNLYGPTETTLAKCWFVVGPEPEPGVQPVGLPLPHTQALVLNRAGGLCGVGEIGEITIRTPYRSLGYLGDRAETEQRFFPNPFRSEKLDDKDLLYRTGDIGRYRPDGNLEILGRIDHQIKVAGVRIEPEEIAEVLSQHADVGACAVVARHHPRGHLALVAYVVPSTARVPLPSELITFLGERLPSAMVPSLAVVLEQLPLTPNGKLDRQALPEPDWTAPSRRGAPVEPRTEAERALAGLWCRLLGLASVGIHDSFFTLGGHSLLAMRLLAEVEKAFGTRFPVRALFEAPTIAGLAALLEQRQARQVPALAEVTQGLLPDVGRRFEPFPLTDTQAAYWVGRSAALASSGISTESYTEFELVDFDVPRLSAALNRLIQRHDMLRAIIRQDGRQQVLAEVPFYTIESLDLRGRSAREVETALADIRERMSHRALPGDRWPLFELRASLLEGGRVRLHVGLDALIVDAWSALLLGHELMSLLEAPEEVPPPPELSFRDYVLAELASRESQDYHRARDYWRARLPELPPAPELPLVDTGRKAGGSLFRRRASVLAQADWSRLRARAAEAGLSPSALLLAAYSETLACWSRSARFTLNVTLYNRRSSHPRVNDLIGNFSTLSLLEVDLRSREPFADRARRLQERLWSDLDHSAFSGVQLMRELARSGRASVEAVMPVVFTSTLGMPTPAGRKLRLPPIVHGITQSAQVFLNHGASEREEGLELRWDALEERFRPGVLEEMFSAYVRRLERLAREPAAWLEPSALETPRHLLALQTGETARRPDTRLHSFFEERAREQPERPAVISPERTLSYAELYRLAVHLGDRLHARGARPGQLIAILMEKGWEQVLAVLGVLYSGAAYLPIAPSLPPERIRYLLQNGEVRFVLTQSVLGRALCLPQDVEWIAVDQEQAALDAPTPAEPRQRSDDLAYVIYTSGSTGEPKGVMIDHRGAVNTILDLNSRLGLRPGDRVLGVSSLSFDLSVYDILGTLAAGAALVLPEPSGNRDPQHWARCITRHGVTVWNSVPALMEMLVEWASHIDPGALRPLRLALLSGDWIPVSLPERVRRLNPGIELLSLGGATEASIWSIVYPIQGVEASWASIPYGRAMANQGVYVLDEHFTPRPVWAVGELYIGGVGVARGYWRDSVRTEQRFLDHPELGRLYRTGDLGRLLPDGHIEFLGREDTQIKLRGHRIELGEIEATLLRHPRVAEAVATVFTEQGDRRLVAYVIAREGGEAPTEERLREHVAATLPAYMVPTRLTFLESLPLTANGKVDRNRLSAPVPPRSEASAKPRTEKEEALSQIWQEVLGAPGVGLEANFFELGGDSILAVQVVARAARAGLRLSVRQFFQHPTIASLAAVVESCAPKAEAEEEFDGEVPLTPIQRWFFERDFADPHHWNQALLLEWRRPVSPAALRQALAALLEHHAALRMRFHQEQGRWVQVQAPWSGEVAFDQMDLSALAGAEQEARLQEVAAERQASLSLEQGPVLRATLLNRGPGQAPLFLLIVHHLVVDGISWRILLQDLQVALEQIEASPRGAALALGPRTASLRSWAKRLREHAQSTEVAEAASYWLSLPWQKVRGAPVDHPGGDSTVASARRVELLFTPEETQVLLHGAPRVCSARVDDLLLTALAHAMARWTGSPAVHFELEGHGREPLFEDMDVSRTVGWFTSLYPVLLDLGGCQSPREELQSIQEQLRQIPGRGVPYGLARYLRGEEGLARRLSALPKAEVSFDYLGQTDAMAAGALAWTRLPAGPTRSPRGRRRDRVEVIGVVAGGQLHVTWTYSIGLHETATMTRLSDDFARSLRVLLAECGGTENEGTSC